MALTEEEKLELEQLESLGEPKSLSERTKNYLLETPSLPSNTTGIMKELSPPIDIRAPIRIPMQLENIGNRIGDIGQVASENIAEQNRLVNPMISAFGATGGNLISRFARPTVQNIFGGMAGELTPSIFMKPFEGVPSRMTNEFLKTPLPIAKSRLLKGEVTTGEDFLKNEILNPSGTGELPSGNKKTIFEATKSRISELGKYVENQINNITEGAKVSGRFSSSSKIEKADLATRKNVVDSVIGEMIKNIEDWDITGKSLSLLKKVKNSSSLDFKTANEFRQALGEYVGKRFEIQDVPEKIDAMKSIFGALRDKIGEISPTIDKALREQHIMYDIQHSVIPEVARGYSSLSLNPFEVLSKSPKAASIIDTASRTRGLGFMSPGSKLRQANYENLNQ